MYYLLKLQIIKKTEEIYFLNELPMLDFLYVRLWNLYIYISYINEFFSWIQFHENLRYPK